MEKMTEDERIREEILNQADEQKRIRLERTDQKLFEVLNKSGLNSQDIVYLLNKYIIRETMFYLDMEKESEDRKRGLERSCLKCGSYNSMEIELGTFNPETEVIGSFWKCMECGATRKQVDTD